MKKKIKDKQYTLIDEKSGAILVIQGTKNFIKMKKELQEDYIKYGLFWKIKKIEEIDL